MIGMNRFGVVRTVPAKFDGTYPLPAGERAAGYKAVGSKMDREPVVIEGRPGWQWAEPTPPPFASVLMSNPFRRPTCDSCGEVADVTLFEGWDGTAWLCDGCYETAQMEE